MSETSEPVRPRVALFVTCMVDALYPGVGNAAVELLEHHGATVLIPEHQTCCGQPAFNNGYRDEARRMARHFLDVFTPLIENGEVDAIVVPSGSCVAMVTRFYEILFDETKHPHDRRRAASLESVTFELTQYLVDVLGVTTVDSRFPGHLTYHACCHLLRELGIDAQPRSLLAAVEGSEIVDLAGADECCGFGGLFAVKNSELSTAMGRRKVRNIRESGADAVAVNDVSCMTHMNGLLERERCSCRAVHIAELLNAGGDRDAG
ncbi:MAG: Fe-S oxidoreductase [Gemmatimonas sp. SG8_38_2]|nr:MAG: Fe-S oxidoreductase [Gemmatimonas sp. SG8_38_2]